MPALSILIPTHERARYATSTVETILARTRDAEVVVCDTSKVDAFGDLRKAWKHSDRLKIIRPEQDLSVVGNFNAALAEASGDYICFIGDDDLVADDLEDIAAWAAKEGIETVGFTFPVHYYWPDFLHRREPHRYSATLWTKPFTGDVTSHDNAAAVRRALSRPGLGVFDMARAYCGLVSRSLVRRVIDKHGALFGGVSPDIYSALLLSSESRSSVQLDYPGVTPGSSGASTAGQSAAGTHVGPLRENSHIGAFKDLPWHPLVPEFYSVPTVWSYSLVKAVEAVDTEYVNLDRILLGRLYARCLLYYPAYRPFTLAAMKRYLERFSAPRLAIELVRGLAAEVRWVADRLSHRFVPGPLSETREAGLNSPSDAAVALQDVIARALKEPPVWTAR